MKPVTSLTSQDIAGIKVLSFDADGVTIKKGTEVLEHEGELIIKTKQIEPDLLQKISRLKTRFHVNFSSGRSLLYLTRTFGPILWEKASVQGENGLFTLIDGQVIQADKITLEELGLLNRVALGIRAFQGEDKNIRGFEPKQFMITVHCFEEDRSIIDAVAREDTKGELYVYWNGEAHDIFLKRFNKVFGLESLLKHLNLDISQALVLGNDINDAEIVGKAGIGITTDPDVLPAAFATTQKLHLGGEEVVDHLLTILKL